MKYCLHHPSHTWGMKNPGLYQWQQADIMPRSRTSLIEPKNPFNYEVGQTIVHEYPLHLLNNKFPYSTDFSAVEHLNFVGRHFEFGPFIISFENIKGGYRQALFWTNQGQKQLTLDPSVEGLREIAYECFQATFSKAPRELTLYPAVGHMFAQKLKTMEQKDYVTCFKFGVLSATTTCVESDLYNNNVISPDFAEFLGCLGKRVELNGFKKYSGGLDTGKTNTTGRYSYYTQFKKNEVMFHVSPYIPQNESDPTRKRHIGNDLVVIIFKETPDRVDPSTFQSKYNHLWVVVQKVPESLDKKIYYRVEFFAKSEVPYFDPPLPSPNTFESSQLRRWLLTKLINGERTILQSVSIFSQRNEALRRSLLQEICLPFISDDS